MKRALLVTFTLFLFICPWTFAEGATVTISPTSWYQSNSDLYGGGGIKWMPATPEILRRDNWIAAPYWNFDLADYGQLNSAYINYTFQQTSNHMNADIVIFTGITNWPEHGLTPSFYSHPAIFDNIAESSWKIRSVDITEGIQIAIDNNYRQITIGFEPNFPWGQWYQANFQPLLTNLELNYTPVPLPATGLLLCTGLLAVLTLRPHRH